MYLALCINPAWATLFGGECYLLQEDLSTGYGQRNVSAWSIPDAFFKRGSFIVGASGCVEPDNELEDKIRLALPTFKGALHRFELISSRNDLEAALHKVEDRTKAAR